MATVEVGDPQPPDTEKQSTHSASRRPEDSPGAPEGDTSDAKPPNPPKGAKQPTSSKADARNALISEQTPRVLVGDNDYTRKYPNDEYGTEMYPDARIWRTYLDERDIADQEYIEDNNATLDGILVFASIFSAILTTFVTQTYQALLQDPQETSLSLLTELVALQRVIANGSSVDDVPSSESPASPFVPSSSDIWLNSLWFISLTLSLLTAFLGVLAKQWLYQYMAVTSGDARSRALVRQARYVGLHDWQVPELIGILPIILHLSLALFFAGLVILLRSILQNLAILIAAVVGTVYVAYIVSTILPIIYPRCPYRTALTPKLFKISNWISALRCLRLFFLPQSDSEPSAPRPNEENSNAVKLWLERWWSKLLTLRILAPKLKLKGDLWRDTEREDALNTNGALEAKAVAWLYTSSYNPTAKQVVLEGLAGSPTEYVHQYTECWEPGVMSQVGDDLQRVCRQLCSASPGGEIDRQLELCVRALSDIQPTPQDDLSDLYGDTLGDTSRSPRLRAISFGYLRSRWKSLGEFIDTQDMAELRLTTSVWLFLFRLGPDFFHFKSILTVLTVLRDVNFYGSDSPHFSDGSLPSTDLYHPNEKMCKAMHAHVSTESLAAEDHLADDSRDELPDALLRLLKLIATNFAYYGGQIYRPLREESTEDIFEALDVILDCLLQIVANEKSHKITTTWSDLQRTVLTMLSTTPLFKIDETDLKDIQPSVKHRVFLKTMSLIGLVYKPTDPLPTVTIPFRSAMIKCLLRVYMDGPDVKGQPEHEYDDSIALLFSAYTRGDDLAYEAFRTENVIPILCNDLLESHNRAPSHDKGDLAFRDWNPNYPQHSYNWGRILVGDRWSSYQLLEHYLAHIPTNQEQASGSPTKTSSRTEQDKEYLFQPETLYCLCSTLLLWEGYRMLIRLLKLKPDAKSWIDCIQRLIILQQSELSKYIKPFWRFDKTKEERIGRLYRDIADIQSILGIDDARLEDPTWKQTVHFNIAKTDYRGNPIKSLLEIYRESESSPEVDREGLATAADEPEASPARKQKWHDRLPLFNLFHRSQAADSSSHELVEILVDPQSATTDVQRSASNQLSPANDDEVSIWVRTTSRIEEVEDGYGDDDENEPEPKNGDDGDELSIRRRNTHASTSNGKGADNDHEPSPHPDPAVTVHESLEVDANAGEGPSNSSEVPDSERQGEESTDNMLLKQERPPTHATTLNQVDEAGAGGRSK